MGTHNHESIRPVSHSVLQRSGPLIVPKAPPAPMGGPLAMALALWHQSPGVLGYDPGTRSSNPARSTNLGFN